MASPANNALAFLCLLTAAALGAIGAPVWLSVFVGCGLTAIAYVEQQKLRSRFAAVGAAEILVTAQLASLASGCATALGAWGVGALFRLAVQFTQSYAS